jgi:hypothetical protein
LSAFTPVVFKFSIFHHKLHLRLRDLVWAWLTHPLQIHLLDLRQQPPELPLDLRVIVATMSMAKTAGSLG